MKRPRLSVLGLMGIIVGLALAFAALGHPSILRASLVFTATVAFLSTAVLGAIARRGRARVAWAGGAVFGWAYFLMSFGPFPNGNGVTCPPFPTQALNESLQNARESADKAISAPHAPWVVYRANSPPGGERLLDAPPAAGWMAVGGMGGIGGGMGGTGGGIGGGMGMPVPPPTLPKLPHIDWLNLRRVVHSLGAIAFGLLGGVVGFAIARKDRSSDGGPIPS